MSKDKQMNKETTSFGDNNHETENLLQEIIATKEHPARRFMNSTNDS